MQPQMDNRQETLKKRETGSLISADKVQGTDIYNGRGDSLGVVESLMIDKHSGNVAFAVVTFGGFLGIGTERRALPWNALRYDVDLGGYLVDIDAEVLRKTPVGPDLQADAAWWRGTDSDVRSPGYPQ
ncbi:PRC-barrel domain-containing protein [Dongia rigui]|uniref:PRC-barrel domain-containing protein n=1 Tax=Dongia rigui TaxID=940149 RepID=A0ABU5E0U5_9PROT|nr:PRC-barrel domain-containing protein [Dongia rigui]MDY0872839.1 PRC-barrel domain-containing protein [Dongia rigui]